MLEVPELLVRLRSPTGPKRTAGDRSELEFWTELQARGPGGPGGTEDPLARRAGQRVHQEGTRIGSGATEIQRRAAWKPPLGR